MKKVRPKKHLGQHFLKDISVAEDIVKSLNYVGSESNVLEIGPGMGVLSDHLVKCKFKKLVLMDVDVESIEFLLKKYQNIDVEIRGEDFLKTDLHSIFCDQPFSIIGNFPYNISSQIFFRILEKRDQVHEVVCMIQKEVAERIVSPPGSKTYGILSVFLQAYYNIEYLFTVGPQVFDPPPKVDSAVIRMTRNETTRLGCNEKVFRRVVKEAFQKRRKTLRNALKGLNLPENVAETDIMGKRAEQLSIEDFVDLTTKIQ